MFKTPSPNTVKRDLYELIGKRNGQFALVFRKVRDPYTILKAFLAIQEVYDRYFETTNNKADQWVKVLMWVYDKNFRFFYLEDLKNVLHLNRQQINSILVSMGRRHLLHAEKKGQMVMYTLTADAHLLLQNFSRDSLTEIMKVVRDGRKGMEHVRRKPDVSGCKELLLQMIEREQKYIDKCRSEGKGHEHSKGIIKGLEMAINVEENYHRLIAI